MKILDVFLHGCLVGRLMQDEGGQLLFEYDESWLTDPLAVPLSLSLPLRKGRFMQKECRGYFAGLLPEDAQRRQLAQNLGISERNDFSLLQKIGGECAGAVTFLSPGSTPALEPSGYRELAAGELSGLLNTLQHRPLLAGESGVRMSLAGAQRKIAITVRGGSIDLPIANAASTHILKPAADNYPALVRNEAFCMRLAALCGLPVAKVDIRNIGDKEYLLVERYDRRIQVRSATE